MWISFLEILNLSANRSNVGYRWAQVVKGLAVNSPGITAHLVFSLPRPHLKCSSQPSAFLFVLKVYKEYNINIYKYKRLHKYYHYCAN